jgi:hypothetical protein
MISFKMNIFSTQDMMNSLFLPVVRRPQSEDQGILLKAHTNVFKNVADLWQHKTPR